MDRTACATPQFLARFPKISDPRLPFALIFVTYVVVGIFFLDFNRTPEQVLVMVGTACALDALMHAIFKRGEPPLFPLSAAITGLSLSILMNFSHGLWIPLIPVFLAIASKYVFTFDGRHAYNPSLFGLAASLLFFNSVISVSPPQQWGGSLAIIFMITTAALAFFVFKIGRTLLITSVIVFYTIEVCVKAYLMKALIPPQTVVLGSLTSPEFFLFAFFMFPDPATSPSKPRQQIGAAAAVVAIDSLLQLWYLPYSLFYSLFAYATL